MTDDLAAQLRAKAEEMLQQAAELEKLTAGDEEPETEVVAETDDGEPLIEATDEGDRIAPAGPLPDEPVVGLPEDPKDVIPLRDPLEKMDMSDELVKVRDLLSGRSFLKRAESADGEVWERPGPHGQQGIRANLTADVNGRINLELRDPYGMTLGQASPAWPVDVEILLQRVR